MEKKCERRFIPGPLAPKLTRRLIDLTKCPAPERAALERQETRRNTLWYTFFSCFLTGSTKKHFEKQKCDLKKLEHLEITIWTDFDKAFSPPRMNNALEFTVNALTKWKADGRGEQIIEISQTELIKKNFLKLRIPEMK